MTGRRQRLARFAALLALVALAALGLLVGLKSGDGSGSHKAGCGPGKFGCPTPTFNTSTGTTTTNPGGGSLANVWISYNGTDSGINCVRSSSPVTNPDPTGVTDCATMQKGYNLSTPGDLDALSCGVLASCNFLTQVFSGTKTTAGGCNAVDTTSCISFFPATGSQPLVGALTVKADYTRVKDFKVTDTNLTINGSFNFIGGCGAAAPLHDVIADGIQASQFGNFNGVSNWVFENGEISGRRDDASQWFPCVFDATSQRPTNGLFTGNLVHDYHMTFPNTCANGGGFTYAQPTYTLSPGGLIGAGTYTYTVRAGFRGPGDTFMLGTNALACMMPLAPVTIPDATKGCAVAPCQVNLSWTDPNPAWKYLAGYDVFGRTSAASGTCPTAQFSETKLKTFYPATYNSPSLRTSTSWTDDGSVAPPVTNCTSSNNPTVSGWSQNTSAMNAFTGPQNRGDVHMECIHIDGYDGLTITRNFFYNCGQYDISWSNSGGSGSGSWFKNTLLVEDNFFGAAAGGNDVLSGPGVNFELQWGPSSGPSILRFNTFAGSAGINASPSPGNTMYGNLYNFPISSFGCNFGGTNTLNMDYDISLSSGVPCGPHSATVAALTLVDPTGIPGNLHLLNCSNTAANFVPTSVVGGFPIFDYDGDPRPKQSPGDVAPKLDAGGDEFCRG